MNIEKKYVSSFRRCTASTIDMWIVLFMRIVVAEIAGKLWLKQALIDFTQEFNQQFGTETAKYTPDHVDFILHSRLFFYALAFWAVLILIGTFYHSCLNSSAWKATIGKRAMKIIMIKEDDSQLTFGRGVAHYFLSVLPFVFVIYLINFQVQNNMTFYQALIVTKVNLFFGIISLLWIQSQLFTKQKTTIYDVICKVILITGKTTAKFPWSK